MCNKNSSPLNTSSSSSHKKSIIMKKTKKQTKDLSSSSSSSPLKSPPLGRRNRTKTRKPKYLSLRLQLSHSHSHQKKTMTQQKHHQQQQQQEKGEEEKEEEEKGEENSQLNLFPLHPENMVEDKDMQEAENNVALLFSSDGGATLNGLLGEDESTTTNTNTTTTTTEEGSLSAFCGGGGGGESGSWLVRKAMRRSNKEREDNELESEERWVCYSEVVEKKEVMEEVTSYCDPLGKVKKTTTTTSFGLLSLKLDHEGIMNAWSDKGSLYVAAGEEAPQIVPHLVDGVPLHNALSPNVPWDGWGSDVGNIWKVPEDCGANKMKVKEEMGWKLGQREASVLRYKEKRQSRLFSKRIRYEVRKLNAEKRPRMKGRFVKRE